MSGIDRGLVQGAALKQWFVFILVGLLAVAGVSNAQVGTDRIAITAKAGPADKPGGGGGQGNGRLRIHTAGYCHALMTGLFQPVIKRGFTDPFFSRY